MLICIPTKNENGIDSFVYGHFGSAPFFVLFDTDKNQVAFIDNSNSLHVHGQCNPVAQLRELNVDVVVVNGMGMNALNQLNKIGTKVYKLEEQIKISEFISNYSQHLVQELSMNDCCIHHGSNHHHLS